MILNTQFLDFMYHIQERKQVIRNSIPFLLKWRGKGGSKGNDAVWVICAGNPSKQTNVPKHKV